MHKKSLVRIASSLAIVGAMVAADALMVTAANADTQIRFSWWGGQSRNEKTDKILQLFEKDNPGITVTREASDWQPHWDKLTIQASAGNQPCTIQMQTRWLATYAKPDILRPLDDLLKDGKLDVRGIAQPVLDSGRGDDGKLYMIPSGVFYFALMYNKSMMEDAGVAAPSPTWTWSDFAKFVMAAKPQAARRRQRHAQHGARDRRVRHMGADARLQGVGRTQARLPGKGHDRLVQVLGRPPQGRRHRFT